MEPRLSTIFLLALISTGPCYFVRGKELVREPKHIPRISGFTKIWGVETPNENPGVSKFSAVPHSEGDELCYVPIKCTVSSGELPKTQVDILGVEWEMFKHTVEYSEWILYQTDWQVFNDLPRGHIWETVARNATYYCSACLTECPVINSSQWRKSSRAKMNFSIIDTWVQIDGNMRYFCKSENLDICPEMPPSASRWLIADVFVDSRELFDYISGRLYIMSVNTKTFVCSAYNVRPCGEINNNRDWKEVKGEGLMDVWSRFRNIVGDMKSKKIKRMRFASHWIFCITAVNEDCESVKGNKWAKLGGNENKFWKGEGRFWDDREKKRRHTAMHEGIRVVCDSAHIKDCPRINGVWSIDQDNTSSEPNDVRWVLDEPRSPKLYCNSILLNACKKIFGEGSWRKILTKTTIVIRYTTVHEGVRLVCDAVKIEDCPPVSSGWKVDQDGAVGEPDHVKWVLVSDDLEKPTFYCNHNNLAACKKIFGEGNWKRVGKTVTRYIGKVHNIKVVCDAKRNVDCPLINGDWRIDNTDSTKIPNGTRWVLDEPGNPILYCSASNVNTCKTLLVEGKWIRVKATIKRYVGFQGKVRVICDAVEVADCPHIDGDWVIDQDKPNTEPSDVMWMQNQIEPGKRKLYCNSKSLDTCKGILGESGDWKKVTRTVKRYKGMQKGVGVVCEAAKIEDCPPIDGDWQIIQDDNTRESDRKCDAVHMKDCPSSNDDWEIDRNDTAGEPANVKWILVPDKPGKPKLYCSDSNLDICQQIFGEGNWRKSRRTVKRYAGAHENVEVVCDSERVKNCPPILGDWFFEQNDPDAEPVNAKWLLVTEAGNVKLYCNGKDLNRCKQIPIEGKWERVNRPESNDKLNLKRFAGIEKSVRVVCDAVRIADCPPILGEWRTEQDDKITRQPDNVKWELAVGGKIKVYCNAMNLQTCTRIFGEGKWTRVKRTENPFLHQLLGIFSPISTRTEKRAVETHEKVGIVCDAEKAENCRPSEGYWAAELNDTTDQPQGVKWELFLGESVEPNLYCNTTRLDACKKILGAGGWQSIITQQKLKYFVASTGGFNVFCYAERVERCPLVDKTWISVKGESGHPSNAIWVLTVDGKTRAYCTNESLETCQKILGDGDWMLVKALAIRRNRWKQKVDSIAVFCDAIGVLDCPSIAGKINWELISEGCGKSPPLDSYWGMKVSSNVEIYCGSKNISECNSLFAKSNWVQVPPAKISSWRQTVKGIYLQCLAINIDYCPVISYDRPWIPSRRNKAPNNATWAMVVDCNSILYCSAETQEQCSSLYGYGQWRRIIQKLSSGSEPLIMWGKRWSKSSHGTNLYCDAEKFSSCPLVKGGDSWRLVETLHSANKIPPMSKFFINVGNINLYCDGDLKRCPTLTGEFDGRPARWRKVTEGTTLIA